MPAACCEASEAGALFAGCACAPADGGSDDEMSEDEAGAAAAGGGGGSGGSARRRRGKASEGFKEQVSEAAGQRYTGCN